MAADRSYFENPGLLARLLAALTAPRPLTPARPSPHASSADPCLRYQAYAPLADKLLDLVARYRRLNPIDIFRVDPDPVQASTQKISGESPLALEAHSESSPVTDSSSPSSATSTCSVGSSTGVSVGTRSLSSTLSATGRLSPFPGFAI